MSAGAQFSIRRFGLSRKTPKSESDILFDLYPHGVLILDAQAEVIQQANQAAQNFTNYALDELQGLRVDQLIRNWSKLRTSLRADPGHKTAPMYCDLIDKNRAPKPCYLTAWTLAHENGRSFLFFAPTADTSDQTGLAPTWISLGEVLSQIQNNNFETLVPIVLDFIGRTTAIENLAVFQARSNYPEFYMAGNYGDAAWLPEQLPAQDLSQLKVPQIWHSGKRPTSLISRSAMAAKQHYAGTFPIGQSHAVIGLLVMAGTTPTPSEYILQSGQSAATLILPLLQIANLESKYQAVKTELERIVPLEKMLREHIHEGSLLLSPELKILAMNPAAEKILGYTNQEVCSQDIERILIGADSWQKTLLELRSDPVRLTHTETRLFRRSGDSFLARIDSHPVVTAMGLENILIIFQDLSQEELARQQAQHLEQRAELGEILAVFAHEVRNPINNISTGLELITHNLQPDDPARITVARLLQDCDRMAELMKSVLAYSRPVEYAQDRVHLESFLQNLVDRLQPRLEKLKIQTLLQAEQDLPPIAGSPRALEQVFINLINNAMQAMNDTGGQITIKIVRPESLTDGTTSIKDQYQEVSVTDTGPGIPPEILKHVFQPFYTMNHGGTGLGLAIAKRIVTAQRGQISVTSFPGGTVFKVRLPVAEKVDG